MGSGMLGQPARLFSFFGVGNLYDVEVEGATNSGPAPGSINSGYATDFLAFFLSVFLTTRVSGPRTARGPRCVMLS